MATSRKNLMPVWYSKFVATDRIERFIQKSLNSSWEEGINYCCYFSGQWHEHKFSVT